MLNEKVKDMSLDGIKDFSDMAAAMEQAGGFSGKGFGQAVDIICSMNSEKCIKYLSFPGCVVSTGLRGIIAESIKKGLVDVIITTCGTLDHDLARAWGGKYYHGSFSMDDAALRKKSINRLGNILIPDDSYGIIIEKNMGPVLEELDKIKNKWPGHELIAEFGKRIDDENSILYQAAERNVPIFVPGITDGAFGTNLLWFSQDHNFMVDVLADERALSDISFRKQKTGALMIGGGISKHHTIWWNQFKGGLDYAVYITTATPYDGSLSGARLEEAVSWGKVHPKAKYVTVDGDATIILPFMLKAVYERMKKK